MRMLNTKDVLITTIFTYDATIYKINSNINSSIGSRQECHIQKKTLILLK